MARSILTVSEPRLYTETTTAWALRDLAYEQELPFCRVDLDEFKARRWPRVESPLIVLHAAHIKIARTTTDEIRAFYPDCKVVSLGSDSIYYTRKYPDAHHGLLVDPRGFEFVRPEGVDLHLDTLDEVVEVMRSHCPTARWAWTASRQLLEIAREVSEENISGDARKVVCYANPRVSAPGGYRPRLTLEMARRGYSVQWGGTTEFVTLDEEVLRSIMRLYKGCGACLGTSSPSWTPCRTGKGFRDWFAPHLGLPLVYDDLPDATRLPGPCGVSDPCLPTFAYEDWDGLVAHLKRFEEAPLYKDWVVGMQRKWASEHVLEKQFLRAFQYYSLL